LSILENEKEYKKALPAKSMITITPSTELANLGGFSVQTWGLIVAIGIIIALILMLREAKRKKVIGEAESLIAYIAIASIIGARLAYVAVNPSEFSDIISIFKIWNGGVISWGFLIGGIIGAFAFKFLKKEKIYDLLDLMAPYFILAIAIGRIGCFLRGCCFGMPTDLPWGVIYTGENSLSGNILVHPTQLYHAIADFIIFFVLKSRKKKTFLLFLILYSLERFFIDFLRFHLPGEYIGTITITQIIFIVIFAIALWLFVRKNKSNQKK
jgi:phosphatidylglycerol:prolipoprotein diacylglycerol transferase